MEMEQVSDAQFLGGPVGRYVLGRSFIAWCATPALCGGASWGTSSLSEVEQMMRLHAVFELPGVKPPMDVIVDGRAIKTIRVDAFEAYFRTIGPKVPYFRTAIRKQALLLPDGIAGSTFIGFYSLVGPLFPRYRVFSDEGEAARWLGGDAPAAVRLAGELTARARSALVALDGLRAYLRANHSTATLDDACHQLGVSDRTLQRQLEAAGTSFRDELSQVRLEVARSLLGSATDKLEQVARRVGFNTAAHFCAWFRRHTGQTPTQYRRSDV